MGASALLCQASASGLPLDVERVTVVGRVFVETVDARRIVIAVSTHLDGRSEHVFLYTASKPLSVTPRFRNWQAQVNYESGGGLRITPFTAGAQALEFVLNPKFQTPAPEGSVLRFSDTVGLSHYVAHPALPLDDLKALHRRADCDGAPQACVEVAGQFLPFPG